LSWKTLFWNSFILSEIVPCLALKIISFELKKYFCLDAFHVRWNKFHVHYLRRIFIEWRDCAQKTYSFSVGKSHARLKDFLWVEKVLLLGKCSLVDLFWVRKVYLLTKNIIFSWKSSVTALKDLFWVWNKSFEWKCISAYNSFFFQLLKKSCFLKRPQGINFLGEKGFRWKTFVLS